MLPISPEQFDIANAYIKLGSVEEVHRNTGIPQGKIVALLQEPQVKRYLDGVYLDAGYRNRNKLGEALDKMIESKIQEAEESGVYTSKDLLELLQFAHKMRMDEIKADKADTVVNVNQPGGANYGRLMDKLLGNAG